ncbi:hypothetical protein B0H14DRAFT_2866997, partial [Mycena olivaceomarginata]
LTSWSECLLPPSSMLPLSSFLSTTSTTILQIDSILSWSLIPRVLPHLMICTPQILSRDCNFVSCIPFAYARRNTGAGYLWILKRLTSF